MMYEKSDATSRTVLSQVKTQMPRHPMPNSSSPETKAPGDHITESIGQTSVSDIFDGIHLEEASIQSLAARLGLSFCTVSELNSPGSAFCGLA